MNSRTTEVAATAAAIRRALRAVADADRVPVLQGFFKTGPGQYGAGDVFVGARLPDLRALCRRFRGTSLAEIEKLLWSKVHEDRLLAALLLVDAFKSGDPVEQKQIYDTYIANTARLNNWDIVDSSAPQIVGGWLHGRSRAPLRRLARSASLWERRIAIMATLHFIRRLEFDDTFAVADILLDDEHDLIHKAVGWMLREVGKRSAAAEREYLATRYRQMPRTMLRYAIEKFPEAERQRYLLGKV